MSHANNCERCGDVLIVMGDLQTGRCGRCRFGVPYEVQDHGDGHHFHVIARTRGEAVRVAARQASGAFTVLPRAGEQPE